MEPLREISRNEFIEIRESWFIRAEQLSDFYTLVLGWEAVGPVHFCSSDSIPCAFSLMGPYSDNKYGDLKTGRLVKGRKLPLGFRNIRGNPLVQLGVDQILHFSPAGCPSLKPFYSVVGCLGADLDAQKYYCCQHRVGECPHKRAGDK